MPKAMMWIYHSTKAPKMVPHSDDLPEGWADTPAAFKDAEPEPQDSEPDLMAMFNNDHDALSKPQLVKLAKKLGISMPSRSSMADFITAIIEHTEE
ncbi:MAG: hypothetical protein ACQES7_04335 [Pseudomonadota bacterium]